jgi:CMP-N-acetylneuraminic acid synthetase
MAPKVTVYTPCCNYGQFLREALDSVLNQSMDEWELIIFNEGSSDNTKKIALEFRDLYPDRVRFVDNDSPRGLRACANAALEMARGSYIMRLDADDYLDESALLVLCTYLEKHQDIGFVYPNWTYVTEDGRVIGTESRKKVYEEAKVLDLPAHGACTMIRTRVLKSVGGYDTQFTAQDGHELWLRTLHRYKVANVQTSLFYYRQHDRSMSTDTDKLLDARRKIKRAVAARYDGPVKPRCAAIIPVKNTYPGDLNVALSELAKRPLLDYTLECAVNCSRFDAIYVSTDDSRVVEHCLKWPQVSAYMRDPFLSDPHIYIEEVVRAAVNDLEERFDFFPDIIAVLNVHSPLRRPEHVIEALDTLLMYDIDQVISTYEDHDLHFRHGCNGLEPLNLAATRGLRLEREALFTSNNAVLVFWRDVLRHGGLYAGRVGHTVMSRMDSIQAKTAADRARAEVILNQATVPAIKTTPTTLAKQK